MCDTIADKFEAKSSSGWRFICRSVSENNVLRKTHLEFMKQFFKTYQTDLCYIYNCYIYTMTALQIWIWRGAENRV